MAESLPGSANSMGESCQSNAVRRQDLNHRIETLLQESSSKPYEKVEVESLDLLPEISPRELRLKTSWPASRTAIEMVWTDCASVTEKKRIVWFKTRAFRKIWVYGKAGAAETALADTMPELALMDLAVWRLPENDLIDLPAFEFLVRRVKAGDPIRISELKPAPLVKRNDDVLVVVQGKGLVIKTKGMALQYGAEGEWVGVMIEGAGKSTRAKVVAHGVVHVDI